MVDSVWLLRVNADGTQDMAFENGDRPTDPGTPPGPVQDLDATANGSYSINLDWSAVDGATEYLVQRSPDNAAWSDIATTAGTSYPSGGLQAATTYWYRVFAVNEHGLSVASNTATDTTTAASSGATDLSKLRWTADWSSEADGAALAGFGGMFNVNNAVVSSEIMFNGRKTAKEVCDFGPAQLFGTGFGREIPDVPFGEQDTEMWCRVWVYHDAGFSWTTDIGSRKWFRQREKAANGSSGGSCDLNIVWPTTTDFGDPGAVAYGKENVWDGPVRGWYLLDPNAVYAPGTGVWECYEFYVRSNSSSGAIKYWKNGVVVGEVTDCRTRWQAENRISEFLFISNWNEGLDKDCIFRWCAPAIAVRNSVRDDTSHMDADAAGFPMIGLSA